jgi:hypothetical protein
MTDGQENNMANNGSGDMGISDEEISEDTNGENVPNGAEDENGS